MLRGAAAAWLGLVALQAVTTSRGANTVGGLLGTVDGLVKKALDPSVAAIPDRNHKTWAPNSLPGEGPLLPAPSGKGPTITDLPKNTIPGLPPAAYIPWPSVPGTTTT